MKNLGGSTPQIVRNPEGYGIKKLFYSESDLALRKDKTVAPGYGVLQAGTVMSTVYNANAAGTTNKGKLVPYVPVYGNVVVGTAFQTPGAIGVAPMVINGSSGHVYVSLADSYKFAVGDELVFENNAGEGPIDCGHIASIDRTTSTIYADIVTEAYTATNATTAKAAYVYIKAAAADPWSTATFILDKSVDTGVGEDAQGALASVIISNAILYTSSLINCSTEATTGALTALGAVQDGQHTILK